MAESTVTTRIQLSWKTNIRNTNAKITPAELAKVAGNIYWNMLSCVSKFMVNSFGTSSELLNVLHVILNK